MHKITIEPSGASFECEDGDSILRAALRAGLGMPYSCNVGSCGNCRFELLEGEVEHAWKEAPAWSERELKRNRWLGCQAHAKTDCKIKFRASDDYRAAVMPQERTATLVSSRRITRDISEFTFNIEGSDAFVAGQYALISAPGIVGPRAFSMSNLPGTGRWSFQIKRVPTGALTGYLFERAQPGDTLTIDGPYGTAHLRPEIERDIILMAGGSGLSPMISLARGAAREGLLGKRKIYLYYGCRSRADLFAESELDEFGGQIDFVPALSDADPTWTGESGFLHDVVGRDFGERLKDHEIYFAGPAVMSAAIQKMAHEAGCPMTQLHFDEFF